MALRDSPLRAFNLALRGMMEAGIVAGLGYWGVRTGHSAAGKAALGLGVPLVGFGVWGRPTSVAPGGSPSRCASWRS